MRLIRFQSQHVRNLQHMAFNPHARFNIFLGANGSGKTSILESIHLLALGRSFRSRQVQAIINHQQTQLTCFAQVSDGTIHLALGIEKNRQGEVRCRIGGEPCQRLSLFASMLPLQLITPETFKLLLAGPDERRRFLDWGVFHVEPSFSELCQRYQRLLKQRNAQLKTHQARSLDFDAWESALCEAGERIGQLRCEHLQQLQGSLAHYIEKLLPGFKIEVRLDRGWAENRTLASVLEQSFYEDKRCGYTRYGPHRAEIEFAVGGYPASQELSRGQQKLLICALYLAQAHFLVLKQGRKSLFVLDDLASELDAVNRHRLLEQLALVDYQVFITDIEAKDWPEVCQRYGGEMFHVEHGELRQALLINDQ